MRKIASTIVVTLGLLASFAQAQSGWTDISANLPKFAYDSTFISTDTVLANLTDVFFISDLEGWVTTFHPYEDTAAVLHTTDGGNSWSVQETSYPCNAIWMLTDQEGFAGADSGVVYYTTNGGQLWDVLGTIAVQVTDLHFPAGETLGYVSGAQGVFCKVTSQGLTPVSTNIASKIYTVEFPAKDWGWWSGGNAMKRYRNGVWKADQTFPTMDVRAVSFIDTLRGIAVGDKIMRTGDGNTWTTNLNYAPITGTLNDVMMVDGVFGWAVGDQGQILRTGTSGDYWFPPSDVTTTRDLNGVYFPSNSIGYAVGDGLTLLKYNEAVARNEDFPNLEVQVYPNPTEGKLFVELSEDEVKVCLLDLMGREIETFGQLNAGVNDLAIAGLPSGLYLLSLEKGGKRVVQRIVLK